MFSEKMSRNQINRLAVTVNQAARVDNIQLINYNLNVVIEFPGWCNNGVDKDDK